VLRSTLALCWPAGVQQHEGASESGAVRSAVLTAQPVRCRIAVTGCSVTFGVFLCFFLALLRLYTGTGLSVGGPAGCRVGGGSSFVGTRGRIPRSKRRGGSEWRTRVHGGGRPGRRGVRHPRSIRAVHYHTGAHHMYYRDYRCAPGPSKSARRRREARSQEMRRQGAKSFCMIFFFRTVSDGP
jgi:hypothetical protein